MSEHDYTALEAPEQARKADAELEQREWSEDDTNVKPLPKPEPRYRATPTEWKDLRHALKEAACALCGEPWESLHHVYPRGQGGDDVLVNLIPLCGSGTTGCHGLIEARDAKAREELGASLSQAHRWYVRYKLGVEQGDAWLERHYGVAA